MNPPQNKPGPFIYHGRRYYTQEEVLAMQRGVLLRMILYCALGAGFSWLFAQLALELMKPWGFDRAWVGRVAVAIQVAVPFCGSVMSFGLWWWKPQPLTRLWRKMRGAFTRRPEGRYSSRS